MKVGHKARCFVIACQGKVSHVVSDANNRDLRGATDTCNAHVGDLCAAFVSRRIEVLRIEQAEHPTTALSA